MGRDLDWDSPERLNGVQMPSNSTRHTGIGNLFERLDASNLVVRRHHRD
jgi:hypothetical protein